MATDIIILSTRIKTLLDFQRRLTCWRWHNNKRKMYGHSYHYKTRYAKSPPKQSSRTWEVHSLCKKHNLLAWNELRTSTVSWKLPNMPKVCQVTTKSQYSGAWKTNTAMEEIGNRLSDLEHENYSLIVDYYSRYPFVWKLKTWQDHM